MHAGALPDGMAGGDVLVATEFADDAAVVRPSPEQTLVLTADVIAPLVDDPADFGRIAAANSLSDVYAMGGRPRWALNLAFFPDELPREVLSAILRGAAMTCREAGVAIVGGHTVRDQELKFGLSVTGEVAEGAAWTNRGGRPGQALVLSKALGTGVVGQAIKNGLASDDEIAAAVASMTTLNRAAMEIGRRFAVTAATDVTGFGLIGHLRNILLGSALSARVELAALPLLPGARSHAGGGRVPGGSRTNLEFLRPLLRGEDAADPLLVLLACDAQTSGGLLFCVEPADAAGLVSALEGAGLPARRIGELTAPEAPGEVGAVTLA
jgi:selenide, water dikinase